MLTDNAFSVKQCPKRVGEGKKCFRTSLRQPPTVRILPNLLSAKVRFGTGQRLTKVFHLYVELTASTGNADNLDKALQSLSEASLASKICSRFDVSRSQSQADTFHLFESFASKEVYPEHVATAHAQHFLTYVVPRFVEKRSVIFLEETPLTN